MKFSERYQYTIVCEDGQTKDFLLNIMKSQGINERKIRINSAEAGIGSGEAFVRREYPKELKKLRSMSYMKRALIVCTDADLYSIEERKTALDQYCKETDNCPARKKQEPVMIWIPRRAIENWIHFWGEEDENVQEETEYRHTGNPVRCKEEAIKMSRYLQGHQLVSDPLRSLIDAKQEYENLCDKFETE